MLTPKKKTCIKWPLSVTTFDIALPFILALMAEHSSRMFENRPLRRTFESNRKLQEETE
jgi:hypothetical protein